MQNGQCRRSFATRWSAQLFHTRAFGLSTSPLSTEHVKGGGAAAAGTHQDAISIIPVSGAVVLSDTKFG
jgi:hypothetical protein